MTGTRRQIGTVGARRERGKGQLTSQFHSSSIRMSSSTGEYLSRQFSLAEMQLATGDFGDEHVIGKGGFGKVYKGLIDNGSLIVAVKRLSSNSKQGQREFVAEMETLSKLRHRNLVSLIGYCNEQGEMILVYEYMPNGTLADYLRRKNHRSSSLTWNERLRICIGAARGLDYLHTGSSVIHRDVKPANILLDENFTAKVSDFGLAKHLSGNDLESHVSASIKGSFGYFDPSYFISGRLTKASDTYAFGVVLLEVLSGRPAIDGKLAESELCLTLWAQEIIRNRKFHQIVDSSLREEISEDCLKTYVGVVKRCLAYEPKKRLSMTQAAAQLELALEQQERKGSSPKLKFPSFNAFWSRVAPSGKISNSPNSAGCGDTGSTQRDNREVEVNTLPEDALNSAGCGDIGSTQKDNNEVDVNSVPQDALQSKQSVDELEEQHNDRESYGVPAILLPEVKNITDDFSSKSWIANGSSGGSIFHGVLKNGQEVAIKRLHKKLLNREFLAQVSFLSGLKHENVIELLGYCVAGDVQVLVHEYAARGSLQDLLHGRQGPTGLPLEPGPALSWVQRINIAVEAAKGLLYFHEKSLIHRNIKSSNVLVCANEIAKISDPHLSARCHHDWRIDGFVEGCCDYHPPEYETDGYTQKGDIYNFGVLLLELLTGCESVNVQWWVVFKFNQTDLHQNVDPRLKGDYPPKAAEKMAGVAELCLKYTADERRSMSDVLQALQIVFLETQDYLLKKKLLGP